MSASRHSVLAGAVLGSALFGSHLIACSGDDAGGAPTTPAPADAGDVGDAAVQEAAVPPPTTISVHLDIITAAMTTNYVVFYPTKSPDNPVVEPIAVGQAVTKEMPDGAHVLFAGGNDDGASIIQVDDVAAGETVELSAAAIMIEDKAPLQILRKVPPSTPPDAHKRFWSCNGRSRITNEETESDTPAPQDFAHVCVEPGGKARFLVTTHTEIDEGIYPAHAIGSAIVDVADGGAAPVASFTWTKPTPTTWTLSGSARDALSYSAHPYFTQSTMLGAFPVLVPKENTGGLTGDPPTLTFLRPPAGFNDGELHWVIAAFPSPPDEDVATVGMLLDRTDASATLTTDLGEIGPHFLSAKPTGTDAGSVDFDFQPSAEFAPGTVFLTTALGTSADDASKFAWLTVTTRSAENRVRGLVLPDVVRAVVKTQQVDWSVSALITAVTGIDARELRTNPMLTHAAFGLAAPYELGDIGGLPRRNFRAKVAQLMR